MPKDITNNPFIDQLGLPKQGEQKKDSNTLAQEQFLELLVAQIENQNPLKPQDNGEFLGQMAQFSTVSGLQQMQKSIDQLNANLMSSQALQASSLVGRLVLVPGNKGYLPEGEGDRFFGAIDVPSSTTGIKVEVTSASGELVKTITLGTQNEGMSRFSWDGTDDRGNPLPAGEYQVAASGYVGGELQALETNIVAPVDSVTLGRNGGKMMLNVAGFGAMDIDSVREIL